MLSSKRRAFEGNTDAHTRATLTQANPDANTSTMAAIRARNVLAKPVHVSKDTYKEQKRPADTYPNLQKSTLL